LRFAEHRALAPVSNLFIGGKQKMFSDTLLESSPALRKRKRWPMAAAFTLQIAVAAALVLVPLLSTGVIQLSARVPISNDVPLRELPKPKPQPQHPHPDQGGPASSGPRAVVLENHNQNTICLGPHTQTTTVEAEVRPGFPGIGDNQLPTDLIDKGKNAGPAIKPGQSRISVPSEAQLINRVEPAYPRTAVLAGIQGQVRLHAIIARDGRVVSLNVISGSPLLVRSALDAVSQWRYRPYYLNGEAIEVETFITVNFKREQR
jgi:protein TonB